MLLFSLSISLLLLKLLFCFFIIPFVDRRRDDLLYNVDRLNVTQRIRIPQLL